MLSVGSGKSYLVFAFAEVWCIHSPVGDAFLSQSYENSLGASCTGGANDVNHLERFQKNSSGSFVGLDGVWKKSWDKRCL